MKKVIAACALGGALLIGFAPLASATESEYLADLESEGFSGPNSAALSMGYEVCNDVANGVDELDTVEAIFQNTGEGVTRKDAQYVYEAAVLFPLRLTATG